MKLPVLFALLTGLFWGMYAPAVAESRKYLASPFKPYVMIGVAYLVWGILGGLVGMWAKKEEFHFGGAGSLWGFIGGSLGAFGALALTMAMFSGGSAKPQVVMPIVFGFAVTVNAIVQLIKTSDTVNPMLYAGIVGMALCIVVVAYNTPHDHPPGRKPSAQAAAGSKPVATVDDAH